MLICVEFWIDPRHITYYKLLLYLINLISLLYPNLVINLDLHTQFSNFLSLEHNTLMYISKSSFTSLLLYHNYISKRYLTKGNNGEFIETQCGLLSPKDNQSLHPNSGDQRKIIYSTPSSFPLPHENYYAREPGQVPDLITTPPQIHELGYHSPRGV